MFLRDAPTLTLEDIAAQWQRRDASWGGGLHLVEPHLTDDNPHIRFDKHEVFAGGDSATVAHLAGFLEIPTKFIGRLPRDEQQWLLERHLERSAEQNITVSYTTDGGVTDIMENGRRRIDPEQIAEVALNVMPEDSLVTDAWLNPQELRLDVIAPEGYERGWFTGDTSTEYQWRGEKRVGDVTGGGVRLYQNRKQNLSPEGQGFLFRLACTNGYESMSFTGKMDARGLTVEEILGNLEAEVDKVFRQVEERAKRLYDLREVKVNADRTGELRRIALDAGLPVRTTGALEDALAEFTNANTEVTMFDFTNLITNAANGTRRPGAARTLQQVGGGLFTEHDSRCDNCHHRL